MAKSRDILTPRRVDLGYIPAALPNYGSTSSTTPAPSQPKTQNAYASIYNQ